MQVIHTRLKDLTPVDIIFISSLPVCAGGVFAVTRPHQNPTADAYGVTVAVFPSPKLTEVTVMWPRQVTAADWQLYLVAVVW